MKILKAKQVYAINGRLYELDEVGGQINIGSIIYDSRTGDFLQIASVEGLKEFGFVAPELYATVKELVY